MGKKSKQGNRAKSAHSFLNIQKNGKILKNKSSRTKKNIKKLFEHLRNESDSSTTIGSNNTVIEVGDESKQENENVTSSFIIVGGDNDEDLIINNTPCPIKCSTPLSSKHSLKTKSPLRTNNNSNSAENFQQEVAELTKEINRDSYLTIDLTTESTPIATNNQHITVIDLANTTDNHTLSNQSLSMSGDSDVTVINTKRRKDRVNSAQMKNFASGIAKMDSSERGKLLELITQTIFNGCNGPNSKVSLHSLKNGVTRATETVENTYIKEVIVGQAASRNSIGSNIYNPERDIRNKTGLRMIVIDGSNVALQHSKGRVFSVKGLKICIDYFVRRGHVVKAFVPQFRCKLGKSTNGKLLDQLERQGLVVYTPSREIQGRMITSYDDRYIVQCAAEFDGVIVSGDNYRDLLRENPRWRHVIENRLLQFTWVGDMIMFPRDPLGRNGPTLEQFLRHPATV